MASTRTKKKPAAVKVDVTPKKLPACKNPDYLIKPGQRLNPHGRPVGSRNKLGEAFLQDLLEDWKEYGAFALADCRKEDPAAYCKIVASILPKEINLNDEESILEKFLDQFTTVEEIRAFRAMLTANGSGAVQIGQSTGQKRSKNTIGSKPNGVH